MESFKLLGFSLGAKEIDMYGKPIKFQTVIEFVHSQVIRQVAVPAQLRII
tara:strand:- start:470 stop:619 length:150 start_codon:yes stop_codon:yes gene_type:complete